MYNKFQYPCVIQGIIRASIATVLCIIIYAVLISFVPLGDKVTSVFIVVTTLLSVMYGAIYATLKIGNKGWLVGLLVAFFYMLILYIVSIICGKGFAIDIKDFVRFSLALFVGTLSGMLGINL